ncbi:MAG TPA: response regulator [Anaerovoracaceae bacterium]|nr:response regulator [Anaerovoracaceae bacterium]
MFTFFISVTHFNNLNFAFHVDSVVGIDRIFWTEIKKPDRVIYGGEEGVATGIAEYKNTIKADNGQEAWNYLEEAKASGDPIKNHVSCIVSDIEMPLMDGHRLTKLVKTDEVLKEIPLILFSSLISDEMRLKGQQLGADKQITKPGIGKLVEIIDRLTEKKE